MKTISSAQFLAPMAKRINDLIQITSELLILGPDKTDSELHYARGRIAALQACLIIMDEENKTFSAKYDAANNLQDQSGTPMATSADVTTTTIVDSSTPNVTTL